MYKTKKLWKLYKTTKKYTTKRLKRSIKKLKRKKTTMSDGTRTLYLHIGTPWETDTVTTRPFLHSEMYENEYIVSK